MCALTIFGISKILTHCLKEALVTWPLSASGLLKCLNTRIGRAKPRLKALFSHIFIRNFSSFDRLKLFPNTVHETFNFFPVSLWTFDCLRRVNWNDSHIFILVISYSLYTKQTFNIFKERNRNMIEEQQRALFAWPYKHIQYCKSYV